MPSEDGKPGLGDLLDLATKQGTAKLRGPAPASVVSYDRATQTCDARLLVHPKGSVAPPDIKQIPVAFPRGAGMAITWDLQADDEVLLVPCEADISAWLARGVKGEAPTARKASFADAIAIPGIGSLVSKLANSAYASGALVVTGDDIRLGSSAASDFVALSSLVAGVFGDVKTWATLVETAINALAPGTFNPGNTLFNPTGSADSVSATKTRAE